MQTPKIRTLPAKNFVGMNTKTSWAKSQARPLWPQFMPRRKEIVSSLGPDFFSIQVYPKNFEPKSFGPQSVFTTWAAVEVSDLEVIPSGMESLTIPGGLYAVFLHIGAVSNFHLTAQFIFEDWIPKSPYHVDDRVHFEILTEKYLGPDHRDSEEEVWIPIKEETI